MPITKANHFNFAENPHRPTLEDQRRTPNEIGLKVGQPRCGRTHGGTPKAQPCQGGSYRISLVGSGGDGGKLNAG